jgi:hypothetical protein
MIVWRLFYWRSRIQREGQKSMLWPPCIVVYTLKVKIRAGEVQQVRKEAQVIVIQIFPGTLDPGVA